MAPATRTRSLFDGGGTADPFAARHVGPRGDDVATMLKVVGYDCLDALAEAAIPAAIQAFDGLVLPSAASEPEVLAELRALAARHQVLTHIIGLGDYDTFTQPVIARNSLQHAAWSTGYTP